MAAEAYGGGAFLMCYCMEKKICGEDRAKDDGSFISLSFFN